MAKQWNLAGRVRLEVADLFDSLSKGQLETPSLCEDWTVRDVLGHATMFVEVPLPKFMFQIAKAGFNYDQMADRVAKQLAERPVDELTGALRAKATKAAAMLMFPEAMTVADLTIHLQDVRRPLGVEAQADPDALTATLDFLTGHKMAKNIFDPAVIEGLQFEATDRDWRSGEGPVVTGAAEALMMGMAGRPVLDELDGPGLETLRARVAA